MILKNLLRILGTYRISLIKIIYYELIYLIKGYKGNKFTFLKDNLMSDNIPCPYYFLHEINKVIKSKNFNLFLDLGCGSGRAIDFFNKNFSDKNFIGIEYFQEQFLHSKKNFELNRNIKIIQGDFIKIDFLQYNADCYFFNHPIKVDDIFIEIIKKIKNSGFIRKNILLIFVNCNNNVLQSLKDIQCIRSYYINNRTGFSIYCINK